MLVPMNAHLTGLIALWVSLLCCSWGLVIEYDYNNFPKDVVALHMPCQESNMFATKCMCHLRCTDSSCSNAKALCNKYESSKGCRYMLIRQIGKNKVATLKRIPKPDEFARFNVSMYPTTKAELVPTTWSDKAKQRKDVKLKDLVKSMGKEGTSIINRLFQSNSSSPYCKANADGATVGAPAGETARQKFLDEGIALTVLSYHTPRTLVNSLRTWESTGLLDMVSERLALLNDPLPQEHAMALQHGFEVLQPQDIPKVKTAKFNVVTIGAAFYYALDHIQSEYLLFLENDFKMDTTLSAKEIQAQLVTAAGMLRNGAEVVRLMSRKYQGCGTFKTCDHHGIHLDSPSPGDRKRNWYAFYCKGHRGSEPYVADCFHEPDYRCFTSWDSNWSLNAVMVKKSTMMGKKYKNAKGQMKSIAEMGLAQSQQQDGFEGSMLHIWQTWRVPVGRQQKTFNGLLDCLVKTAETPTGLYRLYNGFGVSVVGIIPYRGVYFGMYDSLASVNPYREDRGLIGIASKFVIAQTTAITAGYASYPFDTIRRRLQMQSEKPAYQWIYRNAFDCYFKIVQDEGYLALFKGAGANVVRTIGSALVLVLYDEIKHWSYKWDE